MGEGEGEGEGGQDKDLLGPPPLLPLPPRGGESFGGICLISICLLNATSIRIVIPVKTGIQGSR